MYRSLSFIDDSNFSMTEKFSFAWLKGRNGNILFANLKHECGRLQVLHATCCYLAHIQNVKWINNSRKIAKENAMCAQNENVHCCRWTDIKLSFIRRQCNCIVCNGKMIHPHKIRNENNLVFFFFSHSVGSLIHSTHAHLFILMSPFDMCLRACVWSHPFMKEWKRFCLMLVSIHNVLHMRTTI